MKNKLFIYLLVSFLNTLGYGVRSAFGNLDYYENLFWFSINAVLVTTIIYLPIIFVVILVQKYLSKDEYRKDMGLANSKIVQMLIVSFILGLLLISPIFPILSFLFITN
jgi:hypothetical protein